MSKLKRQHPCECSDPGCKCHKGKSYCRKSGTRLLYRVDMGADLTGTAMCGCCAEDAHESGLFTEEGPVRS